MKNYIELFCKERNYPEAAINTLTESWERINSVPKAFNAFNKASDNLKSGIVDAAERMEMLDEASEEASVNRQTLHLLFYICHTQYLKDGYEKAGINSEIYENTIADLYCKMYECYGLYGVWGCRVSGWLDAFFTMKKFGLGRMQFEVRTCDEDAVLECGYKINAGDDVIVMHVPVSDKPFTREVREDAYKRAYEFFKDQFPSGKMPFRATSWLLFPENENILSEKSNIVGFMREFTIVKTGVYPKHEELWRIFGRPYDGNPENLKRESSLQRAYADWVQAGNQTGFGVGYFVYDGNKFMK